MDIGCIFPVIIDTGVHQNALKPSLQGNGNFHMPVFIELVNVFEKFGKSFIDDFFNQQYQSDRQFGKVFGLFTVMAITIACLGLFGLSSYLVTQRTREIGIRKILGASVKQLALLVSRKFTLVMMLAALLSLPVSYFAAKQWLSEFAYKIDLDIILFAAPAILVFLIAIITVAGQSIHAARANPVDTLKTE